MGVPASDLTRSVVVSLLTCCLTTGLAVAVNFATAQGTGVAPWAAVVVLTMLSAVLAIVVHPRRKPAPPQHEYGASPGYGPTPLLRPPRRTVSWATALLVVVLITGVTSGLAYGGWYVTSWLAGTESGPDVLVRPVSATQGPLTVTVERVEVTRHLTKVGVTAINNGKDSITLPLFGNCQLNAGGATMGADPFRSRWNETVPANNQSRGTILFNGKPAEGTTTTAALSFSHAFGTFELDSMTVSSIELTVGR